MWPHACSLPLVAALVFCLSVGGDPDPGREARKALLRSAVCPGWGQWASGSRTKGLAFMGVSAGLAVAHLQAPRLTRTQRRELNRWTILFWLFNLGDAYVDGYLRSFDRQMEEMEAIGRELEKPAGVQVGVGLAW